MSENPSLYHCYQVSAGNFGGKYEQFDTENVELDTTLLHVSLRILAGLSIWSHIIASAAILGDKCEQFTAETEESFTSPFAYTLHINQLGRFLGVENRFNIDSASFFVTNANNLSPKCRSIYKRSITIRMSESRKLI